jgi:hypothetical protein
MILAADKRGYLSNKNLFSTERSAVKPVLKFAFAIKISGLKNTEIDY